MGQPRCLCLICAARSCPKPLPGFPGWSPGGTASSKCGPACHGDPWRKFAGGQPCINCGKSGSHIEHIWLAVLTILKNIESQWEGLSQILWKSKNVWNHPARYTIYEHNCSWNVQTCWNMLKLTSILEWGASWTSLSFQKLQESRVNRWSQTLINIIYVDYCVVLLDGLGRLPADWTGTGAASWGLVISSMAGIRWKHVENLRWNSVCFGVGKPCAGTKIQSCKRQFITLGCCCLDPQCWRLTTSSASDVYSTLSVGFQSEHRDWKCVGMVQRWDNHMSCIVTSCCTSSWKSCAAMLAYRTTHLPPANGPNMSASCSHKSTLEISNQENTWKYHMLTPSRNIASCVIPHITNSEANENIALGCAVNFSKTLIIGLSWNYGLVMIPQNQGGFPWKCLWRRALWSIFGARGQENCGSRLPPVSFVSPLEAPFFGGDCKDAIDLPMRSFGYLGPHDYLMYNCHNRLRGCLSIELDRHVQANEEPCRKVQWPLS